MFAFFVEFTFFGMYTGGEIIAKTAYVPDYFMLSLLGVLTPENRLACLTSMATGLRIGDVLRLKTEQVIKGDFSVIEQKTNKRRRVRLDKTLQRDLMRIAGEVFVFPHRYTPFKPRTRQAVYKDLKRACECFRLPASLVVAPHSCRKIFAVGVYKRTCSIARVKELLNHKDEAVTILYAMADELTQKSAKLSQHQLLQMEVGFKS